MKSFAKYTFSKIGSMENSIWKSSRISFVLYHSMPIGALSMSGEDSQQLGEILLLEISLKVSKSFKKNLFTNKNT